MEENMDPSTVTILGVFIANAAMVLPLFLWVRAESRADIRHMDNKIDAIRELTYAIHAEMKDFHNRLCKIESEKNK
jgi:hypothetical protein